MFFLHARTNLGTPITLHVRGVMGDNGELGFVDGECILLVKETRPNHMEVVKQVGEVRIENDTLSFHYTDDAFKELIDYKEDTGYSTMDGSPWKVHTITYLNTTGSPDNKMSPANTSNQFMYNSAKNPFFNLGMLSHLNNNPVNDTSSERTLKGLFPTPRELLTLDVLLEVNNNISEMQKTSAHLAAQSIYNYFTNKLSNKKQVSVDLGEISALQAVIIVNDLAHVYDLPLTGLAHFGEINRVLIQYDGVDHIFKYGRDAYIMPMTPVYLDKQQGIMGSGKLTEVRRQLNKLFKRWKESDFAGSMISATDVDFSSVCKPAILLSEINSLEQVVQYQIEQYNKKYNLQDNDTFLRFVNHVYASLNLNTSDNDFIEYCIFDACGVLPVAKKIAGLNLRFWHSVSELKHTMVYDLAPVYFGVKDSDHFGQQNLLKPFALSLEKGCQDMVDFSATIHDTSGPLRNLQRCLFIHRQAAIKALLANPLLIAKFLLTNAEQIEDKHFIKTTCMELFTEALNTYKNIPNGPSNQIIEQLSIDMRRLYAHYEQLAIAPNKALYGVNPYGAMYEIEVKNTNYINAITTYNRDSWIIALDGKTCEPEISVAKLPELIANTNNKSIKIITATQTELVPNSILPNFHPEHLEDYKMNSDSRFDESRITYNSNAVKSFLNKKNDPTNPEVLLEPMNTLEAFTLIAQLGNISGAVHLPAIDGVVFRMEEHESCYVLMYTENYSELIPMPLFSFDIDDGFALDERAKFANAAFILKIMNQVINELQKEFIKWKDAHYQGSLFTNDRLMCKAGNLIYQYYYSDEYDQLYTSCAYKPDPTFCNSREEAVKEAKLRTQTRRYEEERKHRETTRYDGRTMEDITKEIQSLSDFDFLDRYNAFNTFLSTSGHVEVLLAGAFQRPEGSKKEETILLKRIANKMGLKYNYATLPFVMFNQSNIKTEASTANTNNEQEDKTGQFQI